MCRNKCNACPEPKPWSDFQLPHNLTGDFTLQLTSGSVSQVTIHRNRLSLGNYGEFQVLHLPSINSIAMFLPTTSAVEVIETEHK